MLTDKSLSMFQFHKGSIKTLKASGIDLASLVFQFHNGSIKTSVCACACMRVVVSIPQRFD